MSVEKKMTKRQMKEDKLVSTTFRVTEYVSKNQTPFIIGVAALIVIASAIMFFNMSSKKGKSEAASMLTQAELNGASGSTDQYIADLQNIVSKHGGSTAGKIATLRLANTFFTRKQYDKAEQYFDTVLKKYSDDKMLAASAAAGKGACRELKSDYLTAAKLFREAAEKSPDQIWTPNYLLKAGQNFAKAGSKNEAKEVLEEIGTKYATSTEAGPAKRTLAELQY
jgi:TolA-binding protein